MKRPLTIRISEAADKKLKAVLAKGPLKTTATSVVERGIDLVHEETMKK